MKTRNLNKTLAGDDISINATMRRELYNPPKQLSEQEAVVEVPLDPGVTHKVVGLQRENTPTDNTKYRAFEKVWNWLGNGGRANSNLAQRNVTRAAAPTRNGGNLTPKEAVFYLTGKAANANLIGSDANHQRIIDPLLGVVMNRAPGGFANAQDLVTALEGSIGVGPGVVPVEPTRAEILQAARDARDAANQLIQLAGAPVVVGGAVNPAGAFGGDGGAIAPNTPAAVVLVLRNRQTAIGGGCGSPP